jgi:hypothetical protein
MNHGRAGKFFRLWYLSGLVGFALACGSTLKFRWPRAPLDPNLAAQVNGEKIPLDRYHQVLSMVESEKHAGMSAADRELVLERMIDEELLFQHARDLELDRNDHNIRKSMISAAMEGALETATPAALPDQKLRAFFESHRELFRKPPLFKVQSFARRSPLPAGWLSANDLMGYLGPTATQKVIRLRKGQTVAAAGGRIRLKDRRESWIPAFETVKSQIAYELKKSQEDEILKHFLADLRTRAKIKKSFAR